MESIFTSEGCAIYNPTATPKYRYEYQYKDNTGDVTLVFSDLNNDGAVNTSEVIQQTTYYPFGLDFYGTNYNQIGVVNKFKFNGKELQDDFGLNLYDYGARHYDPQIGRWLAIDNKAEKYNSFSPYNYAINNPINVIDPDGNDIYLLTWFSSDGNTGHAGIAIDNYKTQEKKDKDGNIILDENGKAETEKVKDGTMTYYDLWPNEPVGKTEFQDNVTADYSKGVKINSIDELKNTDPTTHRTGKVSPEGRAADGIVKLTTSPMQDERAKSKAKEEIKNGTKYNACDNNCSTFAQRIINTGLQSNLNANQLVKPSFPLNTIYKDANVVAPNNLYNAALKIKGATGIKGPANVVAKPYLQYYGK